jgi:hypothetical protein
MAEWIDVSVAVGTLALAFATFWMAKGTSALAKIAEREHMATITPVIRVGRIGQPDRADILTVNEGQDSEALVVPLENTGQTIAEVEQASLSPGGRGELSDPDERFSPDLEPGQRRDFDFRPSPKEKTAIRGGADVVLRVRYRSILSGLRYRRVEHLQCSIAENGDEQWLVVGSETPRVLPAAGEFGGWSLIRSPTD